MSDKKDFQNKKGSPHGLPLYAVNAVRCGRRLTGRLAAVFFRLPVAVFVGTDPAQKAGGL